MSEHVWYFADVNKLRIVDDELHWYWDFMCSKPRHVIYLGILYPPSTLSVRRKSRE